MPEQADGSDARQETDQPRTETEHVWQAVGSNEVSGKEYTRRMSTDEALKDMCAMSPPPPPMGEVLLAVEQVAMELDRLGHDLADLTDKLDPVLRESLLEKEAGSNTAPGPMPGTTVGRKLRESAARIVHLRARVQDLNARAGV